jgi:glycosyltransferase involved in cell wall biosynthesis
MGDKLRIVQVISSSVPSGAEHQVALLARQFQQKGHEVTVVCPPGGWLPEALRNQNTPCWEMPMRKGGSFFTHLKLLRRLKRSKFDIIHTHLTRGAWHGGITATLRRIPIVASVHVINHDVAFNLIPKTGGRLIAVSEFVKENLISNKVPANAIDVVYHGTEFVDSDTQCSKNGVFEEFGIAENYRIVGLVGRVASDKGHLLAIQAIPKVLSKHKDTHFMFVGRVEPNFSPLLEKAIDDLGVRKAVTLTGNRSDVSRLMDAMDIMILPSKIETFGLVVIEAMGRGKPVIATRVGGLPEVIQNNLTGLFIEQEPDELADAINSLLSDPSRSKAMGEAGREWVRSRFNVPRMIEETEAIYRKMVS